MVTESLTDACPNVQKYFLKASCFFNCWFLRYLANCFSRKTQQIKCTEKVGSSSTMSAELCSLYNNSHGLLNPFTQFPLSNFWAPGAHLPQRKRLMVWSIGIPLRCEVFFKKITLYWNFDRGWPKCWKIFPESLVLFQLFVHSFFELCRCLKKSTTKQVTALNFGWSFSECSEVFLKRFLSTGGGLEQ